MKLTKYGHACVVLEENGKKLVIDPGEFTEDFGELNGIVGVVVTHVHGDHLNAKHLEKIVVANPAVKVFTTAEVAKDWGQLVTEVAKAGDERAVGPFNLHFYGELHAEVSPISPVNQNIGVLVNDTFYYPGDSFTPADRKVQLLALPASGPWLKLGESIELLKSIGPKQFFRTHDGLLNDQGLATTDHWFKLASQKFGPSYTPLQPGESINF